MVNERKKIALVKISNDQAGWKSPPLGLLYVGGALRQNGYDVKIYHIKASQISRAAVEIANEAPLFVGLSVLTGQAMHSCVALSRHLKGLCDVPIVWGNAHPSLLPEQCLGEDCIDFVVIGEGEETSVELANALSEGADVSSINGLGYKCDNEVIVNPRRAPIKDLDAYPMDWSLIEDRMEQYLNPYWDRKRMLHTVSSRGCPYDCAFCYNAKFSCRRWNCHSANFIIDQVKWLKNKFNIDAISWDDDNFFMRKERAFEIVENLSLPYYCETRAEYVDDDFARRLSGTDCRLILMGMESGSNRILKSINKGCTVEDNLRAVKNLAKYPNVCISGSFMFGLPTETYAEYQDTINLIIRMLEVKPQMVFTSGFFMPYPGTELYDLVKTMGFVPPKKTEDWDVMNRWRDDFSISWADWLTSQSALNSRKNIILLAMLYRYNIPLLKQWVSRRVRTNSLTSVPDLKFLIWVRELLTGEGGNLLHKIGQWIVQRKSQIVWGKNK